LTVDAATSSVNSGDLNLRYISQNTTLASLNNGQGISAGKFIISNKAGNSATIDLTGSNVKTVGDVMQAINTSGINVSASINATGDGILITDNSSGSNKLQITDLSGTSAAGLHLAGSSNSGTIDGALRYTISIGSSDTLSTVVQSINNSGAPLSASILNDGSTGSPYRLMLTSKQAGAQGRLLVDTGSSGVQLSQVSAAANAILGIGQSSDGAPAVLLTSTNNTFTQVASNLTVTLQGVSSSPISLNVATDTSALVNQISNFISNFNTASQSLTTDLDYDTSTNKGGPLHGDVTALQVQTALNDLFGYRSGNPDNTIQSLSALGITYKDGQLSLDSSILNQQLQSNAAGVQDFFSNANVGFAKKMTQVVNQIADPLQGSITIESNSIDSLVTSQQQQITFLNAQLSVRQAQLQESFNNMESVLASLQSSSGMLSQLANLAQLAQLGFSSSSSGSSSSSSGSSSSSKSG
jgi:flagellar hook-associated protein 2